MTDSVAASGPDSAAQLASPAINLYTNCVSSSNATQGQFPGWNQESPYIYDLHPVYFLQFLLLKIFAHGSSEVTSTVLPRVTSSQPTVSSHILHLPFIPALFADALTGNNIQLSSAYPSWSST